jgi:hypothetical protein
MPGIRDTIYSAIERKAISAEEGNIGLIVNLPETAWKSILGSFI